MLSLTRRVVLGAREEREDDRQYLVRLERFLPPANC
jgi:hypothetical protein